MISDNLYVSTFLYHDSEYSGKDIVVHIGIHESDLDAQLCCFQYIQEVRNNHISQHGTEFTPVEKGPFGYTFKSIDEKQEFIAWYEKDE